MIRLKTTAPLLLVALALSAGLSACGSQGVSSSVVPADKPGAELFAARCSGCHTLSAAGAQGSGTVQSKEKTDGPNLNTRKEDVESTLYAIRNGGFSGQIMPANIVVGEEAQQVADFVAKYAGKDAKSPKGPSSPPPPGY